MSFVTKGISSLMLGLILTFLPIFAQGQAELEAEIVEILEQSAVKGAGIVVVENGDPAIEVYWGEANVEMGKPVDATTVFRAGSISKNVTSLLALRLIEDGRLDANAEITDIAPEIEIQNDWQDTAPVRVIHLLEHTAGLPGSTYREYAENKADATPQDYLDTIGKLKTRWPPGSLYSYSNAGHTVLARVMGQATGTSFDQLVQDQVFTPLGMQSASFLTYGNDGSRIAKSYNLSGQEQPGWEMLIRPSGALTTTPMDLAKLVQLYARSEAGVEDGFLSSEALARMRGSEASAAADAGIGDGAYGFGTFAFIVEGTTFYGHWGKTEGFRANLGYLPGTGDGFVIILNVVDERAANALRSAIAKYLTGDATPAAGLEFDVFDRNMNEDKAGAYVLATHEQPLRAWLFKALDQRRIEMTDEGLMVRGVGQLAPPATMFRPVRAGGFAADGVPIATAAFYEMDGKTYWIDGDAYIKASGFEAWFRGAIIPAALIVSLIALLHGPVWGIMGMLGRGPTGQGLWVRSALLVSGLGFLATTALFVNFALLGDWSALGIVGQPRLVSVLMAVTSIVAVIGGIAALIFTARKAVTDPSLFLIYAIPASIVLGVFALLWVFVGWFPLMTWGW